jgi:hypothetical protein
LRDKIRHPAGAPEIAPVQENEQLSISVFAEISDNAPGRELFDEEHRLMSVPRPVLSQAGRRTAQRQKTRVPVLRFTDQGTAVFAFALCAKEMKAGNQVFGRKLALRPLVEERLVLAANQVQTYRE